MDPQDYKGNERVLGTTNRQKKISDALYQIFPYNCIGSIFAASKLGSVSYANGFLVSSCLVLTAAHTFYDFQKPSIREALPKNFTVRNQASGQIQNVSIPIVSCKISKQYQLIVQKMFENLMKKVQLAKQTDALKQQKIQQLRSQFLQLYKQSQKYDYALLKLEKVIEREQYFVLRLPEKSLADEVVVCGYIFASQMHEIHLHSNRIIITQTAGEYDVDTQVGQSGSPVYLKTSPHQVVGIHKGYSHSKKANLCCVINEEMLQTLQKWMFDLKLQINNAKAAEKDPQLIEYNFCKGNEKEQILLQIIQEQKSKLMELQQELELKNKQLIQYKNHLKEVLAQNQNLRTLEQSLKMDQQPNINYLSQVPQKLSHLQNDPVLQQANTIKHSIMNYGYFEIAQALSFMRPQAKRSITELILINTRIFQFNKDTKQSIQSKLEVKKKQASSYEVQVVSHQDCNKHRIQMRQKNMKVVQIQRHAVRKHGFNQLQQMPYPVYMQLEIDSKAATTKNVFHDSKRKHRKIQFKQVKFASQMAQFTNLKTLTLKFRHQLSDWSYFMELGRQLNNIKSLETIFVQYDQQYQKFSTVSNFTNAAPNDKCKFKVKKIKWSD